MNIPRRHPSKSDLMALAEFGIDRGGAADRALLPVKVAAHVSECADCAREVEGMKRSLQFSAQCVPMEAPRRLTASILLAARNARRVAGRRLLRYRSLLRVSKGVSVAAAALVVIHLADTSRPSAVAPTVEQASVVPTSPPNSAPSAELEQPAGAMQEVIDIERILRGAVADSYTRQPRSPRETRLRRTMQSLDADISVALKEGERNPALARAGQVVQSNRRRVTEEIKSWYVERPL